MQQFRLLFLLTSLLPFQSLRQVKCYMFRSFFLLVRCLRIRVFFEGTGSKNAENVCVSSSNLTLHTYIRLFSGPGINHGTEALAGVLFCCIAQILQVIDENHSGFASLPDYACSVSGLQAENNLEKQYDAGR
ncbi:hypothetical protein BJ878DRAFT_492453 [Calycina marina]|uniref:Secreted protein n=1 Tax=Calycina marina TaxID=1763456 RepID=A0A9P7Z988_9HELO|nr:hypothetical protein BJ878DRAFT_492453 [Calycina marina]